MLVGTGKGRSDYILGKTLIIFRMYKTQFFLELPPGRILSSGCFPDVTLASFISLLDTCLLIDNIPASDIQLQCCSFTVHVTVLKSHQEVHRHTPCMVTVRTCVTIIHSTGAIKWRVALFTSLELYSYLEGV